MQLARNVAPISDNYFLDDEDLAVREVAEYKRHGGNSIVEMTSIGIKRDPEALRRVSEQTGVHIVMGTAYYQRVYHPDDMDSRTVEQLTDVIVRDVTVGVRETGVRSGIVGEVGINGGPLTDNELKSMRAAARAARLTGAPVCIHLGGVGAEKHRMLDIAADEGVDLERVIMGHCDELVDDMPPTVRAAGAWGIRGVRQPGPGAGSGNPEPHRHDRAGDTGHHRSGLRRPRAYLAGRLLEDAPQGLRGPRLLLPAGAVHTGPERRWA